MKKTIFAALFAISCASTEQEKPKETPKGACEYSWESGGSWTTWCYEPWTQTACTSFQVSTYQSLKLFSASKSCISLGYIYKCAVYAKKTSCAWYE